MQLFIDSGDVSEIKQAYAWGVLDGITTNPSLVAKTGRQFAEVVSDIVAFFPGVLNLEVVATEKAAMIKEGEALAKIGANTVVKLPLTVDGIEACKVLSDQGIRCNMTLCFSVPQALLAAKAGAFYISPFIGRLDDIGQDGVLLVDEIVTMYANYNYQTQVLAASIRSLDHVTKVALSGADIATVPFKILEQMFKHELTDKGLEKFLTDWKESGQKNLV
jgi:transaldolase